MAKRKPIIAGNWKMFKTASETEVFLAELKSAIPAQPEVEVVVAPPSVCLAAAATALKGSPISLAAQNCHWEDSGAFTGEVSPPMLKDIGCTHVIIGHSERRQYFGETDESVNKKTKSVLAHGLTPIVCVGETLPEREAGRIQAVIETQVKKGLEGLGPQENFVVAYEPVWAIGTGKTATPEQAEEVHRLIRDLLKEMFGEDIAGRTRILYGGSVKPDNVKDLMAQPNIDGGLIGGASLKVDSFNALVRYRD